MNNGCPGDGRVGCFRHAALFAGWQRRLIIIALVGLFASAGGLAPTARAAEGAATIDADQLNLRAEPGTWSWVMARLGYGEAVTILAGPTGDGWYQIQTGDLTGWVHGWYLLVDGVPATDPPLATSAPVTTTDAAEPATAAVGGVGTPAWVTTQALNLRAAPADAAGVIDVAGPGDQLSVVGTEVDGYVPVSHWSGQAWVWSGFLSYSAPASGQEHWADIDRSSSMVTLYAGDQAVASYWGAMSADSSESGFYATAIGTYWVYEKHEELSWTIYGQAWVRNWVAFDPERLNGFHSFSMDQSGQVLAGGDGFTGGCIALAPSAAEHVSSFLSLGSRVVVHW